MKVLFVGSFLSKNNGTKSIAEKLSDKWKNNQEIHAKLVSRISNKYFRLLDILLSVLLFRGDIISIDVFSGKSLLIAKLSLDLAKFRNKKVILTLRGGAIIDDLKGKKLIYKKIFERADFLQSPSIFLSKSIKEQLGFNIHYMPNPISHDYFKPNLSIKRKNLLWVRAFTDIYNPILAVDALGHLVVDFPDIQLTMVGPDKGLLNKVQERINELGLASNITITGPIPNEELPILYQKHAIYLNTTKYESFGTAVFEAAATKMPIVSTKVGELPFLWSAGENIEFIEKFDSQELANKVKKLLIDNDKQKKIGESAYNRTLEFDWKIISKRWIERLKEINNLNR